MPRVMSAPSTKLTATPMASRLPESAERRPSDRHDAELRHQHERGRDQQRGAHAPTARARGQRDTTPAPSQAPATAAAIIGGQRGMATVTITM